MTCGFLVYAVPVVQGAVAFAFFPPLSNPLFTLDLPRRQVANSLLRMVNIMLLRLLLPQWHCLQVLATRGVAGVLTS
jgi:hypothetical protein